MNISYRINGIDCANCAAKIERKISKIKEVKDASFNFMTSKLFVEIDNDKEKEAEEKIIKIVKKHESSSVIKRV